MLIARNAFFTFLALIHTTVSVEALGSPANAVDFSGQVFDYLVVGGGTAGLVVASRLAQNPLVRVGLIEAGRIHLNDALVDTPILAGQDLFNSDYDWSFQTAHQTNANGRVIPANRGKLLGGSSGINFMLWQRASRPEYDAWQQLGIGNGWNWAGLLPFFKKSESVAPGPPQAVPGTTQPPGSDGAYEGRFGPVQVGYNNFYTNLTAPFVESFVKLGNFVNSDPDNGNSTGIFNQARSVDVGTGNRSYSTTAYFLPNQNGKNLWTLTQAQVTKVNFASALISGSLVATGVQFVCNGITYQANATKEVILSAGSFQTPQLLELSGIGNATLLQSLGIAPLVNLPDVGENLQDHHLVNNDFNLKQPAPITSDALESNATFAAEQESLYLSNHTGVFTLTFPVLSFIPLGLLFSPSEIATLRSQLVAEIMTSSLSAYQRKQVNVQLQLLDQGKVAQVEMLFFPGGVPIATAVPLTPGDPYVTIIPVVTRPYSRGSVHINTDNPLSPPVIDPKYLSFSYDLQVLVRAVQFVRQIGQTNPLASYISVSQNQPPDVVTDSQVQAFIQENLSTEYHPIGTASMGSNGNEGVVDDRLIVHGTKNLRVVDASVIPIHIAAHLQATVYAIAEKASAMILADFLIR